MFTAFLMIFQKSLLLWIPNATQIFQPVKIIRDFEDRNSTAALKSIPQYEAKSTTKIMDRKDFLGPKEMNSKYRFKSDKFKIVSTFPVSGQDFCEAF